MTLVRYLSRLFASRFLAVLLGFAALTQLMELLDAAKQVFGAQGGAATLAVYTALRLPLAVERLFPLAVLIGAVLTFRRLVHENEATILRAAGLSGWRILAALLPMAALLSVLQFALVNWIAPTSERAFVEWWRTIDPPEPKGNLWLRVGDGIVSVERVEEDGKRLERVAEYRRDAAGRLTATLRAASARFGEDGWVLTDAVEAPVGRPVVRHPEMAWPDGPAVENVRELLRPTERLSAGKALSILHGEWSGGGSRAATETKLMKTLRAPVLPVLMLLLATPALGGGRRTGGMARGMAVGLALGLAFLIVDGFLSSMSEAGTLPAVLAVWAAPLIFAAAAGWLLIQAEE